MSLSTPGHERTAARDGSGIDTVGPRNIVFVSICNLTEVFHQIALGLEASGHRIFWITTDTYWTGWLRKQGTPAERILELVYLPQDAPGSSQSDSLRRQIAAAERLSGITANLSILADQFVAGGSQGGLNRYILLYYRDIKRFLIDRRITHLFAEPTNANELIAYIVCRELGIPFIAPGTLRYPPHRLVFFDGYRQERIIPRAPHDEPAQQGWELIAEFVAQRPVPYYFEEFSHLRDIDLQRLMRSLRRRVDRRRASSYHGLTHRHLTERISQTMGRAVNRFYLKRICRYERLADLPDRIAFYPLHVQPEASIDVQGAYFSDQLKLIKDIRRALPFDTVLAVKEHPNFLGTKKIAFYRAVRRIPNVALIRHDVSVHDIYARAAIVLTVTGTAAYEAGLLGIPAVVFSPIYFAGLSSIRLCTDLTMLSDIVFHLMKDAARDIKADAAFMEGLVRDSYDAFWSDPVYFPQALAPENIKRLQAAFVQAVTITPIISPPAPAPDTVSTRHDPD